MKNFTNNFKQFTSRLSARWLIMALMMLVGTSSAWAAAYLSGDFNSWGAQAFSNGTCSISLNANTTYYFKIRASNSNWNTAYGNSGVMTDTNCTDWLMSTSAGNCGITTKAAGTYIFSFNESTKKLSVTYPAPPVSKTYKGTIKFKRPSSWANTPHIHMFYDGSNTLVDNKTMTKEGVDASGNTWYKYDYSITTTFTTATIMFNNGGWNNGQTAEQFKGDLGTDYCLASATSTTSTRGNVTTATCPVYCTPPAAPTLNPNSTTVCSGTSFTLPSGYRWYTVETGGTKLSSNIISAGVTKQTKYYAEAGEDGCVSTSRTAYTVNVDTKPAITLKTAPTICEGSTITFSDYVQPSTGTITWHTDANCNEAAITSATPSQTTTYYVKATNGVCDPVTSSLKVTVSEKPKLTLKAAPTICNGTTIAFPDYVDNNNTIGTVSWYLDEDRTQSAGVTARPSQTTTYYAKAVSGVCDPATAELKVTVNDKPGKPTLGASNTALVAGDNAILTVSNTETGATYTLYKDGVSTGETGTSFTVNDAGSYTVKGKNDCGESDASTAVVITVCNPIKSAKLYFADSNYNKLDACPTYCAGSTAYFVLEYTGERDGDKTWTRSNNFATNLKGTEEHYYFTINTSGSISVTIPTCDGTSVTTNTLTYPVGNVTLAPATPTISFTVNPVGQSKVTTLSIDSYNADNNYIVYRSDDNAVGNDTEVGAYTAPMNISHNDTGSYYYYAKATNKSCANLTATSAIVKLDVQEAGATIAALGDLKVDPQDPVDFVAMYVKNDGLSDFTDQGATKVTNYTWQFSSDGGNTWTPCVSTATIGVTNGSDKCNNFRPSAAGKYRCKVTYDVGEQTSNVLTVTGDATTARTFKGVTMNIPVISVNTGSGNFPTCDGLSGTASKNADVIKEKISVDVKIFNTDGTVYYDRKARMNYRGSSSLNFVKKSYAFCTGKEKTKNDKGAVDTGKENLFGLSNGAKDKDWVLYAAAADPSIMRNRLMFDTFRDMTGGWSVNSMYVELVINGEYKGVYVLMDKITANEKRVNVSWNLDKQGNTTQEGFIVKFDKTDIVDRYENTSGDQKTFKSTYSGHDGFTTYDTQIDQRFEIEYPEKEDIEEEDQEKGQQAGDWSVVFNSIKDKFIKFEQELAKGNFSEVQKIIDYQSWADWFIITEFGKNIDGYRASNLFVYDGSKPNAKIEARPLWDQELSFDNRCPNYYAKYGANSEKGLMVDKSNDEAYNNDASTPFWFTGRYKGGRGTYNGSDQTFKGLLDDPCFVAVVKARWEKHKADALSKTKLDAKVTAYTNEMGAAKDREATFWSTRSRETCQCSFNGTTGYVNIDIDTSKGTISSWINKRPEGLSAAINALKGLDLSISLTVTPGTGITTPWEAVIVQVNNPSGYDYDLEYTTNTLDKVSGVIINENNDKYTYRIPRPENWGYGDDNRTGIEYGIQATLKVDDAGSQCGSDIDDSLTKATATITLVDEENDGCNIK